MQIFTKILPKTHDQESKRKTHNNSKENEQQQQLKENESNEKNAIQMYHYVYSHVSTKLAFEN